MMPDAREAFSLENFAAYVWSVSRPGGKLSLGQRVALRLIDGLPPRTPAERDMVRTLLRRDWAEDLAERKRRVFVKSGRGSGKSLLGALFALHRAATGDPRSLAPGQWGYVPVVAPVREMTRPVMDLCGGFVAQVPALRGELSGAPKADALYFHGSRTGLRSYAATKAGVNLRGKPTVAAVLDEVCFFRDADTGVVNDADVLTAAEARRVEGGQALLLSSPWTRAGLAYDVWEKGLGRCVDALVIDVPHPSVLNPAWIDPGLAPGSPEERVEVGGEWIDDTKSGLLTREAVLACVGERTAAPLPRDPKYRYSDAIDLSGGGDDRTGYTVGHIAATRRVVDGVWSWNASMPTETRVAAIRDIRAGYGIRTECGADAFALETLAALGRTLGVPFVKDTGHRGAQVEVAARLVREGLASLPADKRLVRDLPAFAIKHGSGGTVSAHLPQRDAEGGHFDEAQAVVLLLGRMESQAARVTTGIPVYRDVGY